MKPVLIVEGNGVQRVSEINEVTKTDRVYKLEDLTDVERGKEKEKK